MSNPIEFYVRVLPAILITMAVVYIVYAVMRRRAPRILRAIVWLGGFVFSTGLIFAAAVYLYFGINEHKDSWVGMGLIFLFLGVVALSRWSRGNNPKVVHEPPRVTTRLRLIHSVDEPFEERGGNSRKRDIAG
jgi:hypothetical protein